MPSLRCRSTRSAWLCALSSRPLTRQRYLGCAALFAVCAVFSWPELSMLEPCGPSYPCRNPISGEVQKKPATSPPTQHNKKSRWALFPMREYLKTFNCNASALGSAYNFTLCLDNCNQTQQALNTGGGKPLALDMSERMKRFVVCTSTHSHANTITRYPPRTLATLCARC